ncbi:MAG: FAD-dependent monooxygenase [Rhodobacteraceae bacterium]|nr:FAD-dependent monooxygenase [Paracoccaceae bacterium]
MKADLNIGIAGCGIGGLALGALLAAKGDRVQIFDQFKAPSPVGSGLVVQPVGLEVLRALGVGETVLAKGAKITHMNGVETGNGKVALNVSYGARFGLAIHRASLFDALLKKAVENGCEIIPSTTIATQEGRNFTTHIGTQLGPFDLLVDASGAGSKLSPLQSTPLKYGALWATVDWPSASPLPQYRLSQVYGGATRMAGVLPIGSMPGESTPKAAVFWSLRVADYEAWLAAPLAQWQQAATAFWPEFLPFISQITSHEILTMARYKHGTLRRKTHGRMAYIGDAAHCASPQLGQGANMALLDAYALGTALGQHPVENALKAYDCARRHHVFSYQMMSRLLTPLYQSDSAVLPWLRNHILAPFSPVWPFSKVLTKVGAGDVMRPVRGLAWPPR